ncbi:hypothetical protein E8E13_003233 [Curvularia kusanoi]|uniref:Uncharacterized protein n=1 Tax=Curvularia kusanoi TaxID=90978 RepID=A0A9P4T520_CURKU|nr:hypothetical protein E8E13_003233 [Curvularia kusanoi]
MGAAALKKLPKHHKSIQKHKLCGITGIANPSSDQLPESSIFLLSTMSTPSPSSSRSSSITMPGEQARQRAQQSHGFMATLKKPFQGWSKDLLWAKTSLDEEYTFASGQRRGAHLFRESKDEA